VYYYFAFIRVCLVTTLAIDACMHHTRLGLLILRQ
jgi:hypothetical protein